MLVSSGSVRLSVFFSDFDADTKAERAARAQITTRDSHFTPKFSEEDNHEDPQQSTYPGTRLEIFLC